MKNKEQKIIILVSFLIAVLGLFQTLVYVFRTPPGFVYPLVHNWEQDYYWYLSLMRQGKDGAILLTSKYTPEVFVPQFVNTFFPVAGWLAGILGISLPFMYTVLRVIGGAGLLVGGWWLVVTLKLSRAERIMVFLLVIFGAPAWFIQDGILHQSGEFWTGFDPILRIAWLPHHTLSNALFIGSLIFLIKIHKYRFWTSFGFAQDKRQNDNKVEFRTGLQRLLNGLAMTKKKGLLRLRQLADPPNDIIWAGIFAAISAWLNPASLIILVIALGIAAGIGFIFPPRESHSFGKLSLPLPGYLKAFFHPQGGRMASLGVGQIAVFLIISLLPVFQLLRVQNSVFPWTAFRDWEKLVQYPVDWLEYLKILGLVGIIGVLGIIPAIRRKDFGWNLVTGWFLAPFAGLSVLSGFLQVSNGRFMQSAGYVPAAILCVSGLEWMVSFFTTRRQTITAVSLILAGLVIFWQLPAFAASVDRQLAYVPKNMSNDLVMIAKPDWNALMWLSQNGLKNAVIIAPFNISVVVPAFTSLKVILGHPTFTLKPEEKTAEVNAFYYNPDPEQAGKLVYKYKVEYVWVPDWFGNSQDLESLGFSKVYDRSGVRIYKKE